MQNDIAWYYDYMEWDFLPCKQKIIISKKKKEEEKENKIKVKSEKWNDS